MTEKDKIKTADEKGAVGKASAAEEMPPEPEWLFYVLSFFIPILGIILGIIYMNKPERACKSFGQVCLALGIVNAILSCFGYSCILGPGIGSFAF
jgi:hypothetical protein